MIQYCSSLQNKISSKKKKGEKPIHVLKYLIVDRIVPIRLFHERDALWVIWRVCTKFLLFATKNLWSVSILWGLDRMYRNPKWLLGLNITDYSLYTYRPVKCACVVVHIFVGITHCVCEVIRIVHHRILICSGNRHDCIEVVNWCCILQRHSVMRWVCVDILCEED